MPTVFSLKKFEWILEIHSLSADCLPSRIKASVCGVLASQLFGRSVANLFNLERVSEQKKPCFKFMVRDETISKS
ncbi:hypothetical protein [Bacillus simplex]|uniref:hypothetical protein n=1 Tax=Peribacillus simplex TaxID=1478 RepID=UPI0012DA705D